MPSVDLKVNNGVYDHLGERWYLAQDDPVALLRAESKLRNAWIQDVIRARIGAQGGQRPIRILDIGCGAGFLSNSLGEAGFSVDGIDLSESSLNVARKFDPTGTVRYQCADACAVPFESGTFDVACAMDFLEHVPDPGAVVAEASRVLRSDGLFFYYTFNRNPLSWLVAIKGVEWFVRNTPPQLHLYRYFIRPQELDRMCEESSLRVEEVRGARPVMGSRSFWKLLWTGRVPSDFRFCWTSSRLIAYAGFARKV